MTERQVAHLITKLNHSQSELEKGVTPMKSKDGRDYYLDLLRLEGVPLHETIQGDERRWNLKRSL